MKVLFICNQNQNRSKTAEHVFRQQFYTRSAGLYNSTPVREHDLAWADIIFVMEDVQRSELAHRFPRLYLQKRILVLDIPDIYRYNDPQLVTLLASKLEQYHSLLSHS